MKPHTGVRETIGSRRAARSIRTRATARGVASADRGSLEPLYLPAAARDSSLPPLTWLRNLARVATSICRYAVSALKPKRPEKSTWSSLTPYLDRQPRHRIELRRLAVTSDSPWTMHEAASHRS